jgi:hypothetical protein
MEDSMYSATADVAEMQALCREIANARAASAREKDRVSAVQTCLGLGWNRCLELLSGKARRVDGWEKDLARARVAAQRRQAHERKVAEHLAWLQEQIDRCREGDAEFRGVHVDALQHLLRVAGDTPGAVEVPAPEVADHFNSISD